jgi:hypothetical protein
VSRQPSVGVPGMGEGPSLDRIVASIYAGASYARHLGGRVRWERDDLDRVMVYDRVTAGRALLEQGQDLDRGL